MSFSPLRPDDAPKPYQDILAQAIETGLEELRRPATGLLLSGLSAGLDIGFGPFLMAVMSALMVGSLPKSVTELLMAFMYSLGFVFVVLGRSELFTEHTTVAVLPVLDRQATLRSLARLWGLVYVANIVGGALFAAFAVLLAPPLGVAHPSVFVDIAKPLVDHAAWVIVGSAVLAGWLMGLLTWLIAAARDTTSRLLVIVIVTAAIGLAHLPHCIAGNVEVLMGLFAGGDITLLGYVRFLVSATMGNAIGGAFFVALLKYGHVVRSGGSKDVTPGDSGPFLD